MFPRRNELKQVAIRLIRNLSPDRMRRIEREILAIKDLVSDTLRLVDIVAAQDLPGYHKETMLELRPLLLEGQHQEVELNLLRQQLRLERETTFYRQSFENKNSLVTIIIPTHTAPQVLWERALPSALNQSHRNLEILLVVNSLNRDVLERCKEKVLQIDDSRVQVVEAWGLRPDEQPDIDSWHASGNTEFNAGLEAASGSWVSPFAHDDLLTPTAIEKLLFHAQSTKSEVSYGDVEQIRHGETYLLECSYPPVQGKFGFQGSIRNRALNIFRFNQNDVIYGMPNDWAVMWRMRQAGVRIGHFHEVTSVYYPSQFT